MNQEYFEDEKKHHKKYRNAGLLSAGIVTFLGMCCGPLIPIGPEGIDKAEALGWVITTLWFIYVPGGILLAVVVCNWYYRRQLELGKTPLRKSAILIGFGIGIVITLIARLIGEYLYYNLDTLLEGFY